ncbi:MAG: thioredoxin-dependent thiol peroxidase [Alphaproteobacteria bacterium]|nr:thioredoxin-dependent thiol peroxidase [Alphaproteobacteria bacterium]
MAKDLKIGDTAPNFTLPTDGNGEITLSQFKGQKVVLYFYPKDDTPGCTKESCTFNENLSALNKMKAQIIGLSKCSVTKHDKFKAKYNLNFPLASDENGNVCETYGTWIEKSMYGRKYMGIDRSTFLIDENGKIEQIWRAVKVPGHVEEVMEAIKNSSKKAA